MKRAALILARGFEESESLTIADVLIRAGLTCELTGLEEEIVETERRLLDGITDEEQKMFLRLAEKMFHNLEE